MFIVHFKTNYMDISGELSSKHVYYSSEYSKKHKAVNVLKEDKSYWKSGEMIKGCNTFLIFDCDCLDIVKN